MSISDANNLYKSGKSLFASGAGPSAANNFTSGAMGANSGQIGATSGIYDFGGSAAAGSSSGGLGSFGGGLGGGGSGGSAAAGSNPYGWIAAALLSANVAHNKGISPWSDAIKGKGPGNWIDYYQGKQDGKDHGLGSKIFKEGGAVGEAAKAYTDFGSLDFKNGLKHSLKSIKNIFKPFG